MDWVLSGGDFAPGEAWDLALRCCTHMYGSGVAEAMAVMACPIRRTRGRRWRQLLLQLRRVWGWLRASQGKLWVSGA